MRSHRGFVVIAAIAIALLLVATQRASFFHDEWMFIDARSFGDPATWFLPHVQHFVAVHAGVYTALLAVFGTSTYLPFLLVLFATHVAFTAGIYALIDRHVGRGPALVAASILLLLGSGWDNLFWAFQMGTIGSAALSLWGLLAIRQRPRLAAVLMGLGAATSLYAFMLVPAAALYGWSHRSTLVCAVPVAVYATWYLTFGRARMQVYGDPPSLAGFLPWIPKGIEASTANLTGLGALGLALLMLALLLVLRAPDRRAVGLGVAALLTEYGMLGLGRQGVNLPDATSYTYFGSAFLLPVFATAWRGAPRLLRPAFVALALVALASNALELVRWSTAWPEFMRVHEVFGPP